MKRKIEILIYNFTGKQGFFTIPAKVCPECDLTVDIVRQVQAELSQDIEVAIKVKGWWVNLPQALAKGCWQAPCVLVNNKLVSQGKVPDKRSILEIIKK